ncbi:glycoside hydrolase family 19 protein [Brachyspira hyodysenteriae]|uniref:glycoside hydrolase family 19 protein n=1 Tax=Brachyspira hyodysenteriae TaxID=159 RepID=UPI0022CD8612|nr:glycoside hydrolase family 19 protein [Brachyspira hyodysenteriae]MCZ9838369.1 glycoside hydrolase family 19 protein [Brachyspira hyodysenteriae]MCZ9861015.1 glycoside hydrolase family 19 protein [Brachyspira hyodysenteriae]MCZ9870718.1 glycoside hydrolase family 19 protein [Brachyspira hyodysenteriae]MCZ9873634.1 glycoside hydrolase family 19 protein [Brachyspira hyodysenteriae]MCZ9876823.1 glycoside hydrolase family 19 protein [Brachyspira hyodysenteriae]
MIKKEQLEKIGIDDKWLEHLNKAFQKYHITDINEKAMFLAQTTHESNDYKRLEESFRYTPQRLFEVFRKRVGTLENAQKLCNEGAKYIADFVYGGRLGNAKDEGYKYRGRGIIQLTGKNNYKYYGEKLNIDLVNNPHLAKEPDTAIEIALLFWKEKECGLYAKIGDVKTVTKLINGGYNGLDDRQKRFDIILKILQG